MSNGFNKVILVGNLGKDPEIQKVGEGSVCKFSLCVNDSYTDKSGAVVKNETWLNIEVWGKQGLNVAKYCKKGRQLHIEGKLKVESWDSKKHPGEKVYATKVVGNNVIFLGNGNSKEANAAAAASTPEPEVQE
jgi:single-strand DNA-binding protein